ncbi:Uncharacterized protein Fot_29716 [Forsythia ovata]|uniref:Uncharacterized protein n=1 Tax=Forsythia ovata TaxID=205694 RepID=A0ABD1TSP5_9LAMI
MADPVNSLAFWDTNSQYVRSKTTIIVTIHDACAARSPSHKPSKSNFRKKPKPIATGILTSAEIPSMKLPERPTMAARFAFSGRPTPSSLPTLFDTLKLKEDGEYVDNAVVSSKFICKEFHPQNVK